MATSPSKIPSKMSSASDSSNCKDRVVICIGDLHGYMSKLQSLWSNLQYRLPASAFESALVIFLGDYCDRGPGTSLILDFLIFLPSRYPNQTHVFLCGNHEFAFSAFVGALPPPPDGSPFSATWAEFQANEEREGWFKGTGYENMHVQGRIWGGCMKERFDAKTGMDFKGSVYDAAPTFESYGVPHGSPDLAKAVPEEHKKFLSNLAWVHEEDNVWIEDSKGKRCCKLMAVHAGLEKAKGVEDQLKQLKAKDTSIQKVEALSGRKNVWEIPKELAETPTIVVSGHHGVLHIEGLRLIIDEGGGLEQNPVAAIILPTMEIVRDTDVLSVGK